MVVTYESNFTICSPAPRSIFNKRLATHPYNGLVTALPPSRAALVSVPTLTAFADSDSLSARSVSEWDGAPSKARSMCAVSTCCAVGEVFALDGAAREEKLEVDGEEGVGV